MSQWPAVAYLYDGTFDGLLTAVFDAFADREPGACIHARDGVQLGFEQEARAVVTREDKARRVERGIAAKIGRTAYETVWTVFWSGDPDKDTAIYRYLRTGFQLGWRVHTALTRDEVAAVEYLAKAVNREVQHLQGFVRFSQMEGGVYYSRIEPRHSLVPLLMPHFADRFSDMPFLLHDAAHDLIGVYDMQGWSLVESREIQLEDYSQLELEYRRLWKRFYDSIAVRERISHRRRRQMMPMFYWKNLSELHPRWDQAPRKDEAQKQPGETAIVPQQGTT